LLFPTPSRSRERCLISSIAPKRASRAAATRAAAGRPGGEVDLPLRLPKELGGAGDGANPEQLLAIAYAARFEASMTIAAGRVGLSAATVRDVAIGARVMLIAGADGQFRLRCELDVWLPSIDDAQNAAELVHATHAICPYSRALRGDVAIAIAVNGIALETGATRPPSANVADPAARRAGV
jgi:lipoyl-dependent peroxiredoxin